MKSTQIQISCGERKNFKSEILKKFNISTNVIASSYQRSLTKKTLGLQKIMIDLFAEKNIINIGDYKLLEGVSWIHKSFDFEKYFAKDKDEQKVMILHVLNEAILQMCDKFELDKTPFINAYNKVVENNYKNQYVFNKLTLSKNRKHKAGIEINMTEQGAGINIIFTDKNEKILKRKEIFRTQPHYYFIYQVIYSGKWLDNNKYIASSKNKNVNFIASIDSDEIEIDIRPKEKKKEILEKLNSFSFFNSKNQKIEN